MFMVNMNTREGRWPGQGQAVGAAGVGKQIQDEVLTAVTGAGLITAARMSAVVSSVLYLSDVCTWKQINGDPVAC